MSSPFASPSRRPIRLLLLAAVIAACFTASARGDVSVLVSAHPRPVRPVGDGFLGLALEYRAIPAMAGSSSPAAVDPVLVHLIANLEPSGRPVLRIGGQSTDRSWWPVAGIRQPLGVTYTLSESWAARARALAEATNARLVLGINLEANRTRIEQVEADQLRDRIPARYIDALEIGNEPELYTSTPWYLISHGAPVPWYSHAGTPMFSRGAGWGPGEFGTELSSALKVLPSLPIAGPASGATGYLDAFDRLLAPGSRIKLLSWHAYGLNACVTDPRSPVYPSIQNLLGPAASEQIVAGAGRYVGLAHARGAGFRVDEMNSVTCNGKRGVSDTFASALWAADALFTVAAAGIDGVNIHTYPQAANGLFDFARRAGHWQGTVHPLYYGVLLFSQAAPAGSRLLPVSSNASSTLRSWATLGRDHRVRVLLIDDSLSRPARVLVRAPAGAGPAALERLRAASASATGGVSLGGQSFGPHTSTGALAAPVPQTVSAAHGTYLVTLPPASAALLTLPRR